MALSRRSAVLFLSASVVFGSLGGASAEDATIKIGMTAPMTGPAAEIGHFQIEGAKIAVEKVNAAGGVDGRKLELVIEDDQTTNPGIVLAFSRLVNRGDIAAIVSSVRSTQVNAISSDAKKAAIPVFFGGTDPTLTHSGNPWLFRTRPNDSYSAKVIADFGVNVLKKKKWAIVYSTDAFGTNGMKALTEALKAFGVTPVLTQGFTNGQTDMTPVVLAVRQSGADIINSYSTFENDVAVLARQYKQFGVNLPWVGSPSLVSTTAVQLAGPALYGTYAVSDFSAAANPVAKTYDDEFQKRVKRPADFTSAWAYDAITILADAMKKAGGTDPQKVREAILATKNFQGAEGLYNFDENGDGLRSYNIVRNDNGKVVYERTISFDK
jgi:branched-chain amino acid transport system substrate-binding protein